MRVWRTPSPETKHFRSLGTDQLFLHFTHPSSLADLICSFWAKVNRFTHTPVNAVWLVVAFCSCLNLIAIGSTATITAIFNVTAPALDLSYIAVIIAHRVYENRVRFIEGPFTLGRWSKPINTIAVAWVVFISVILFFPTTRPVTALNMNYAICVAGFIALFSMVWWFLGARKYVTERCGPARGAMLTRHYRVYTGPRTKDLLDMLPAEDPEEFVHAV